MSEWTELHRCRLVVAPDRPLPEVVVRLPNAMPPDPTDGHMVVDVVTSVTGEGDFVMTLEPQGDTRLEGDMPGEYRLVRGPDPDDATRSTGAAR